MFIFCKEVCVYIKVNGRFDVQVNANQQKVLQQWSILN